jgi:DNA-directed RNA polymerase specialized sigma subunit
MIKYLVKKYNADIKDIKLEFKLHGNSRKSKDICIATTSGVRLTDDEILEAKIIGIQQKIDRDQKEIDEINYSLESIKEDEFQEIVKLKYFENKKDTDIAELLHTADRTIRRHKNRLLRKIMVRLYGADAIQ